MRITDVSTFKLTGKIRHTGEEFWEERLLRPIDVYPRFASEGPEVFGGKKVADGELEVSGVYVEVKTDEGITGITGPIGAPFGDVQACFINKALRHVLVGEDALAVEKLWDQMYRYAVHGGRGETMMAISALDCALWDLLGKYHGVPVYRLLGGPTREKVRAYASTLGYSVKPELVAKRCAELVDRGYRDMKWFVRYGPRDGSNGIERNIELVKAVRGSVGYDVQLMIDCWMSWSVRYTMEMAKKLERYEIAWIEEPLMPDDIDGYVELTNALDVPIAGGEHQYTRWGFKELLDKRALDIIQPDITWAGGVTECMKICALASSYGVPVIPHTSLMSTTLNLLFSKPQVLCPIAEYLTKWNIVNQNFYKVRFVPEDGCFKPPDTPGIGIELDESRILEKRYIS